jgi:hypothetical protein
MLPALMMLNISISFVGATSFHAREMVKNNKPKPLEITFNCYPQAESDSDVLRHVPQHVNRTIRQSAHIKLYSHCEQPKVTKLQTNFLMECGVKRVGREIVCLDIFIIFRNSV